MNKTNLYVTAMPKKKVILALAAISKKSEQLITYNAL
jgi:hypothetical protein